MAADKVSDMSPAAAIIGVILALVVALFIYTAIQNRMLNSSSQRTMMVA